MYSIQYTYISTCINGDWVEIMFIHSKILYCTFIKLILMRFYMNANEIKMQIFHFSMVIEDYKGSPLYILKNHFFWDILFCNLNLSKLYLYVNIIKTQILHQVRYDLKVIQGHAYKTTLLLKSLSSKLYLNANIMKWSMTFMLRRVFYFLFWLNYNLDFLSYRQLLSLLW